MNYIKLAESLKKDYGKKVNRTLRDMKNKYQDKEKVKKILKKRNPVIYKVFAKEIKPGKMAALTVINSRSVSRECFMTKGHKHKNPLSEKYILIKGQGKIVLQNSKSKIVNLKKNKEIIVPGKYAHRAVNTGKGKLGFLSIYDKKSGHNYKVIFKKRIFCE